MIIDHRLPVTEPTSGSAHSDASSLMHSNLNRFEAHWQGLHARATGAPHGNVRCGHLGLVLHVRRQRRHEAGGQSRSHAAQRTRNWRQTSKTAGGAKKGLVQASSVYISSIPHQTRPVPAQGCSEGPENYYVFLLNTPNYLYWTEKERPCGRTAEAIEKPLAAPSSAYLGVLERLPTPC